jgi:predicted RecB family nuclease
VSTTSTLTDDIFAAFLKCRYKAFLKLRATAGEPSEYQQMQARLAAEYRRAARQELLRTCDPAAVVVSPPSLAEAIRGRPTLILDAAADDADGSCRLDALERTPGGSYTPILLAPRRGVEADDRMRLAFGAAVLARVQGSQPDTGRIVHGPEFKSSRVSLPVLLGPVRDAVNQIRTLQDFPTPPPLVLNRHCPECEYHRSCRAAAVEKDDLSLLRGLSAKEIGVLHDRGIFTVTQFSHTFRPARLKRVKETGGRREHALQALAVREKKVYIARRPRLPDGKVRAYLDVEGLPDRDFYYLIGLSVEGGEGVRRLSFWADREADEPGIWNAFLEAARGLGDDFAIHHYGSYETEFLERMSARHGGDSELLARLKAKAVNVLSAVHAGVYFPAYANDLKSVAGCLGFRWSAADASGLQSIVWRHAWEETGDHAAKERLLTYNWEDCEALELVTAAVRSFGSDAPPPLWAGVPVAGADEIKPPTHRKYGNSPFALPAFASITKCAYFDYQRNKVLCRTSPAVKASLARKKRTRPRAYRVNQEVEVGRPTVCPDCGSSRLDQLRQYQKKVVDLKPFRSGLKRWVVRYKAMRCRCAKCGGTCLPEEYLARSARYDWGVCRWVVYSSVVHRQSNDSVAEGLDDLFGIQLSSSYVSRIRRRAVEHYRTTYEGLLAALRKGSLVHADETKVEIKGAGNAYVWVFASPDTAVYVYAPTREGATVADTLKGFEGVLVSDFYSAYDSVECPQQKCLVHLIRDLNDDLLKHPFDEDLKQLAARFTSILQPVIGTIDRFGLKKYHLGKHKPAVERFFAGTSEAEYKSDAAKHYRGRFLKNRDKLFTFLDHDGVPWNNNNAENAVKLFASRRKVMGNLFTERGIKEYLLLLSLYQTLRYRGLGFWKFLLSGETDLAALTARRRSKDPTNT